MLLKFKERLRKNPPFLLFISYLTVIIIGGILLMFPFSSANHDVTKPLDAFFTSTSALCVTGLTTVSTTAHWSLLGHILILLLIQLGGVGIMTAMATFGLIMRKRISLSDRLVIAEEKHSDLPAGMMRLVKFILLTTCIIESIGTILLSFAFIPRYGWGKGIWYAIFHSISAFCNAGFDLIGSDSMSPFADSVIALLTLSLLIIIGGIGYGVYRDITGKRRWKRFSLQAKMAISTTIILLFIGTLAIYFIEAKNPATLGNMPFAKKFLNAFFQSTTTRTAGFSAINQAGLKNASSILVIILMLIGGSPAGTAGGIKTTTLVVQILATRSLVAKQNHMTIFNRSLPLDAEKKASVVISSMITWMLLSVFILSLSDTFSLLDISFEVASALGTVGLSRGITASLSTIGQLIIMSCMLFGKLGPLGVLFALTNRPKPKRFREAEEIVLIG